MSLHRRLIEHAKELSSIHTREKRCLLNSTSLYNNSTLSEYKHPGLYDMNIYEAVSLHMKHER